MRSTFGVGARRPLFAVAGPITSACGESQSQQQRESNMSGQLMRSEIRKMEFNRVAGRRWEILKTRNPHGAWSLARIHTGTDRGLSFTHAHVHMHGPQTCSLHLLNMNERLTERSNIRVISMLLCSYYVTFSHLTCNSHQTGSFTPTVGCFARGRESGKRSAPKQSAKPLKG